MLPHVRKHFEDKRREKRERLRPFEDKRREILLARMFLKVWKGMK